MAQYQFNSGTFVSLSASLFAEWNALQELQNREVEICNLALANIGERAIVTSIAPPDGSAQSVHCARFYPIARDILLERHVWDFTTKTAALVSKTNDRNDWKYAFEFPENATGIILLRDTRRYGYEDTYHYPYRSTPSDQWPEAAEHPVEFAVELNNNDERTVYADVENPEARYSTSAHDPSNFSQVFVRALSYELAAMLAGVIVKGDEGAALGQRMMEMARGVEASAQAQDASKRRRVTPNNRYPWARR